MPRVSDIELAISNLEIVANSSYLPMNAYRPIRHIPLGTAILSILEQCPSSSHRLLCPPAFPRQPLLFDCVVLASSQCFLRIIDHSLTRKISTLCPYTLLLLTCSRYSHHCSYLRNARRPLARLPMAIYDSSTRI
jgi:hypothetical protein